MQCFCLLLGLFSLYNVLVCMKLNCISKKIMLFMKGTPTQPQCGFSRAVIQILDTEGAKYETDA